MENRRHFELTLTYKSESSNFDTNSFDVIMADNLVSLASQFTVLLASMHHKILTEERMSHFKDGTDDDIPF